MISCSAADCIFVLLTSGIVYRLRSISSKSASAKHRKDRCVSASVVKIGPPIRTWIRLIISPFRNFTTLSAPGSHTADSHACGEPICSLSQCQIIRNRRVFVRNFRFPSIHTYRKRTFGTRESFCTNFYTKDKIRQDLEQVTIPKVSPRNPPT